MAKKVMTVIKLQIPAGAANPAPPVGPALGQHGVNIMEFCKAFNAQTQAQSGTIIPVEITVFEDRSFTFITKTPPAAVLLREAAGVEKGSGEPNRQQGGEHLAREGARDRRAQAARPERERCRCRDEDHRGHRAQHGHRDPAVVDRGRAGADTLSPHRRLRVEPATKWEAVALSDRRSDHRRYATWPSTAASTRPPAA